MTTPFPGARVLGLLNGLSGQVAVVGSLNADLTVHTPILPKPGQTVHGSDLMILPGGKSANQAATAALLGVSVAMIGAVGTDGNGSLLVDSLTAKGADCSQVRRLDVATGTAVITVDGSAENMIVISPGANGLVDADLVSASAAAIAGANVLGLCLEIPMPGVVRAAQIAKDAGVPVVFNLSPYGPIPDELLPCVEVLIVNEHELADMLGTSASDVDWAGHQRRLAEMGVPRAVITLGAAGAVVLEAGLAVQIPPVRVEAKDTTGCGDSFMGTILAGLASGYPLADCARLASVVAARAATGIGAQASYGSRAEIAAFIEQLG